MVFKAIKSNTLLEAGKPSHDLGTALESEPNYSFGNAVCGIWQLFINKVINGQLIQFKISCPQKLSKKKYCIDHQNHED